mmetsp:Transcript_45636/g.116017  ORF Transcript_45636/g.116017 Transcript_45636/m.116017 type:complete len:126 (-) Transcript_45636:63-440(-)
MRRAPPTARMAAVQTISNTRLMVAAGAAEGFLLGGGGVACAVAVAAASAAGAATTCLHGAGGGACGGAGGGATTGERTQQWPAGWDTIGTREFECSSEARRTQPQAGQRFSTVGRAFCALTGEAR